MFEKYHLLKQEVYYQRQSGKKKILPKFFFFSPYCKTAFCYKNQKTIFDTELFNNIESKNLVKIYLILNCNTTYK
jgi:hypothetical protein